MEVEVFIYGVPSGESFLGKEEDRKYFGSFYNQCSDKLKFVIQTRTLKGKPYCYYNYLVYKDVVDYDGRDGSYFGISLRFEANYCKDFFNMYRILDVIYNAYVLRNLLSVNKGKLKYTIPDFKNASNLLQNIENSALQLIKDAFFKKGDNNFIRLDGFQLKGEKCPNYNLYDCTQENVQTAVMRYGKVAISPYYPRIKDKTIQDEYTKQLELVRNQYETQLQADRGAYLTEKNEWDNLQASFRNEVKRLNSETSQKDENIKSLEAKVRQLEAEIKNYAKVKNIAEIVEPLKVPIMNMAAAIQLIAPDTPQTKANKKDEAIEIIPEPSITRKIKRALTKKLLIGVFGGSILLNFVFLLYCLFPFKQNESLDSSISDNSINGSTANLVNIQGINEPSSHEGGEIESAWKDKIEKVKLDINDYSGSGSLQANKTYKVTAKNGLKDSPTSISWINTTGCTITLTSDANVVEIKPIKGADSVRIVYNIGKHEQSRSVSVK